MGLFIYWWSIYWCNKIFIKITNNIDLKIDLTDYNNDSLELKQKMKEVSIIINKIFKSLTLSTNTDKIDKKSVTFLKSIYTSNNFIPFKFFSLFELSRIKSYGGCLFNIKEQHKSMIISIFILLKILVKNILIDLIFTKDIVDTQLKK